MAVGHTGHLQGCGLRYPGTWIQARDLGEDVLWGTHTGFGRQGAVPRLAGVRAVLGPLAANYRTIALSSLRPAGGVRQGGCWNLLPVSPPRVCLMALHVPGLTQNRPCTPALPWARCLSSLTKGLALLGLSTQ